MPLCDGCGAVAPRTSTAYDRHATVIKQDSFCSACRPEETASDPFLDPSDRKVWLEATARPHLYQQIGDQLIAKDSLLSDIEAEMTADPDAEIIQRNIARKRRDRRTTPMTPTEIEQAERRWRPIIKAMQAEVEADDKQLERELNALAEKHMELARNERTQ